MIWTNGRRGWRGNRMGGGEVRAGESKEGEEREGGRERVARLRQRNKLTVLGRSQKRRLNVR